MERGHPLNGPGGNREAPGKPGGGTWSSGGHAVNPPCFWAVAIAHGPPPAASRHHIRGLSRPTTAQAFWVGVSAPTGSAQIPMEWDGRRRSPEDKGGVRHTSPAFARHKPDNGRRDGGESACADDDIESVRRPPGGPRIGGEHETGGRVCLFAPSKAEAVWPVRPAKRTEEPGDGGGSFFGDRKSPGPGTEKTESQELRSTPGGGRESQKKRARASVAKPPKCPASTAPKPSKSVTRVTEIFSVYPLRVPQSSVL